MEEHEPLSSFSINIDPDARFLTRVEFQSTRLPPLRRCWFMNESKNRFIQLQSTHYYHNWQKVTDTESYPSFAKIYPEYTQGWSQLKSFLKKEKLPHPIPNHWDVTYVNHLEKGKEWESLEDLENIFSFWGNAKKMKDQAENIGLNFSYVDTKMNARLQVQLNLARRNRDAREMILLKFISRGTIKKPTVANIKKAHEFGHKWIVNSFTALTTEYAHKEIWDRYQ